ncbi:MAG: GtrA family protein [Acidobacteriota bacterium]
MKPLFSEGGWRETVRHFWKFNAVGFIGIGVQLAVLAILKGLLSLHYLLATLLAVEAAVLHNFVWHERWTWADRTRLNSAEVFRRLLRFNLTTGAFSIGGNLILMRLLVGVAHLHYLYANIITIVVLWITNFLVSDRYVFRESGQC